MKHIIDKLLPEHILTFVSLFDDLPISEFEPLSLRILQPRSCRRSGIGKYLKY
jgi:hypothetical protein